MAAHGESATPSGQREQIEDNAQGRQQPHSDAQAQLAAHHQSKPRRPGRPGVRRQQRNYPQRS